MINVVLFDFADTIAKLVPSKEKLVQTFVKKKIDLEISLERIEETYFYLQNLYFYSSVKITNTQDKASFYREYNKKIFSNLGILHEIEPFVDDFFDYFSKSEKHWVLKDGVIELLDYLHEKELKIGLISNFDTVLIDILDTQLKIKERFDYIHISQGVGLEKPDPAFYEHFLHTNALHPQQILYVGDNYELDFLPAYNLGINTVLLDEQKHYLDVSYTLKRIDSITDIKSLV